MRQFEQGAPRQHKKRHTRPQDTSALLTTEEAAARLRMDRNGVYGEIRAGRLMSLQKRPGGKHRIPVWAIERYTKGPADGTAR